MAATSTTTTERSEHHARRSQSAPALALGFTPLPLSPVSFASSDSSDSDRQPVGPHPRSHPVTPPPPPRPLLRAHSGPNTPPNLSLRPRHTRHHARSNSAGYLKPPMSATPRAHFSLPQSVNPSGSGQNTPRSRSPGPPGSPPPYSLTPPETDPNSPFLFKRAASSPHLHSPPQSPALPYYPHSSGSSRIPSSAALQTQRSRQTYSHADTSDDPDTDADASMSEDTVIYTSGHPTLAGTLRARLLGKGKGRADDIRMRSISTAPGVIGAGETETEGEDSPRNLPTARITPPSSSLPFLSSLSVTANAPVPSPLKPFIPLLWELSRLLSIVPAVFGTIYNLYYVFFPPGDSFWWRVEFLVSAMWSILTGWQCLMMTSGLLKRWRVYYSPLPTLIRLLGLQAICWPATHLTLTVLEHSKRPLICWAAIATTTCCSRTIQMWVTSNIIVAPLHSHHNHARCNVSEQATPASLSIPPRRDLAVGGLNTVEKERMKMGRRRKWDWGAVGLKCALPAAILYFVMAWVEILRREWEIRGC